MRHTYGICHGGIALRPMDADASEKYRLLRNQKEIGKWFATKGPISREQQQEWFQRYLTNDRDVMFAVFDGQGRFIGANSIYDIDGVSAAYGQLIIDPAFGGRGYGVLATRAAALIARNQMKLERLRLEVYAENLAAVKTYQKVGFTEKGTAAAPDGAAMLRMELELAHI